LIQIPNRQKDRQNAARILEGQHVAWPASN